jgi:hypothetical protein
VYHDILEHVASGIKEVDAIYLDLSSDHE